MVGAKESLENLISSESASGNEMEEVMLLYDICKRKRSLWSSAHMEKRNTHREFLLPLELSDDRYMNYFRSRKDQFEDVHSIVQNDMYSGD